jgi:hypothetical protein
MPKWTEYTSKNTLADNDEVMLYDATARANKRGLMSKFWDYVVDKMATAVISKLETNNKTIIGAINALYSDLGSHNTFYKNLGDDNNPLNSYDLTLKGGAKSDNEISYLIFIGDRGYSTFIKTPSLYIASGGVTYASVQRLILGSNSSIEASITKGNPFTVSFTGFAPKSSLLICIPLVRA